MAKVKERKKDKGGQIKHGIIYFVKKGEFHPLASHRRALRKDLESLKQRAIAETSNMSIKKEMLINDAIFCQGIMDLAMLYISKVGLFEEGGLKKGRLDMQPIIRDLGRFMNTKRQNLIAVGLDPGGDGILTPLQIAQRFDEEKKKSKKVKDVKE